ncbi:hypothetical protein LJN52_14555 [Cellulomonas sp. zg-Y338]|uniref:Methionine synthase n=1 Tax=Cellulomonas chengniuliangii TaxID=2968084 RepID=A0ABY5L0I9_9CELL|nr:hypothetical protein [Cellulomonas chengniuliangii]MCC2309846.1 hypothetical protein [Cellulomonas chengniuliangii]UUI76291.1 hypothetical protein NP064_05175 [Cellulomonas chengniuliangii]
MTAVTGSGPWPGDDVLEAQTVVVGDLAETPAGVTGMPFAVRLPQRGPWGGPTGSAAVLLADLPTELGPHGWKLADRPGGDLARAQALRREDLDALAVAAHGYAGPLVVPVTGPLTLAARLYLARGDRVLADRGALDELAWSLAAGVAEHLADVRRLVPGAEPVVLLHEPLLAQAVAGVLPSFSGYSALRAVPAPVATELLGVVVRGARPGAGQVVVHGGAAWTTLRPIVGSGADGVALALAALDERAWEAVAGAVEDGASLWGELPPLTSSQCAGPDLRAQADALTVPWRRVGLPAAGLGRVTLLPPPPDASATPDHARAALAAAVRAAELVAERAEG